MSLHKCVGKQLVLQDSDAGWESGGRGGARKLRGLRGRFQDIQSILFSRVRTCRALSTYLNICNLPKPCLAVLKKMVRLELVLHACHLKHLLGRAIGCGSLRSMQRQIMHSTLLGFATSSAFSRFLHPHIVQLTASRSKPPGQVAAASARRPDSPRV